MPSYTALTRWARPLPSDSPYERAAGVRAPERRAEPGQAGHEGDPGGVVDRQPEAVEVGRLGDQADLAQPADRRPTVYTCPSRQ
jgi:hypothetical protein